MFFELEKFVFVLGFKLRSFGGYKLLHVNGVPKVDWLDLSPRGKSFWFVVGLVVVLVLFDFYLFFPVFPVERNHEILKVLQNVRVLGHVTLIHILLLNSR